MPSPPRHTFWAHFVRRGGHWRVSTVAEFSTLPFPQSVAAMGKKDKQAQAADAAAPKEPGKSGKKRRAESEAAAHDGDDAQAAAPKVRVSA